MPTLTWTRRNWFRRYRKNLLAMDLANGHQHDQVKPNLLSPLTAE